MKMKIIAVAIAVAGLSLASFPASAHGKFHQKGCVVHKVNKVKCVHHKTKAVKMTKVFFNEVPCCNVVNTCDFCGW